MRSFSYTNPDNGAIVTLALVDHGDEGAVILFGDLGVKTLFIGAKNVAAATYEVEVAPYKARAKEEARA